MTQLRMRMRNLCRRKIGIWVGEVCMVRRKGMMKYLKRTGKLARLRKGESVESFIRLEFLDGIFVSTC
jgi:hypothetical protein